MIAVLALITAFSLVIEASLFAVLVIGFVFVVQNLLGRRLDARMRHMLWGLVIARLALPWVPASPLGLDNVVPTPGVDMATYHRLATPDAVTPMVSSVSQASLIESAPIRVIVATVWEQSAWALMLPCVWLAGALAFGLYVLLQTWRLPQTFGATRPVRDTRILQLLHQCAAEMNLAHTPALLVAKDVRCPVVYGIFRPRMVIPESQLASLSDTELRHVVLHELAHLKRRDLPLALLVAALQAVHWFNPFVWYGFYRMRQDREYACDAMALGHLPPTEIDAYGHTLIKMMNRPIRPRFAAAAILEHRSNLERRIDMIIRHSATRRRLTWFGFALIVACALPLFTRASAAPVQTPVPPVVAGVPTEYPYAIPIELYETSWSAFRDGDAIVVTELRGTAPTVEVGESYRVKGTYVLESERSARLHQFSTNGDTKGIGVGNEDIVNQGSGEFTFEFSVLRPGMLHVSYYPVSGGEGFGDCYFRRQPLPDDDPNGFVDLTMDEGDFTLAMSERWKGYALNARIQNKGNVVSPEFKIWFYQGDPATAKPITHQGGPLHPGETWSESSMRIELSEGENIFYVVLDADDAIAESDETNNAATVSARGRKVVKEIIELEPVG